MSFIEGIGGAFLFSQDPKRLAHWYVEKLGMSFESSPDFSSYYQVFWGLDPEEPTRKVDTNFSILRANIPTERPAPDDEPASMYGDQPFMVNLRTRDLDGLVEHLEQHGVKILGRQNESYGKFAWVRDADGNRVELYQPITPS